MVKYDKPSIKPILEHYGARVPTRKGWFSMRCPFHDDRHASASANIDENVFCCFACQVKGDGYAIIMKKEGVNFREAISTAERILNASGEVLPQRPSRSGGLSRRTGNQPRTRNQDAIGRRARASNGA